MSWKQGLRPASLGGVAFHVESRDFETGRRLHNHEYPKRDDNFAEDMGRKTRRWMVQAYLVGDDYMARRDRLKTVCEQQGAKSYVDRWGISHQVVVEECQIKEAERDGRYCTVSLKLIAAGSAPSAMGIAAAIAQVMSGADGLSSAALVEFAQSYAPGQMIDANRLSAIDGIAVVRSGATRTITGLDGLPHTLIGIE